VDLGRDTDDGRGTARPVPVVSLDGVGRATLDSAGPGAAPIAMFDAEQVGAGRTDVPVADLGDVAVRRVGPVPREVQPAGDRPAAPPEHPGHGTARRDRRRNRPAESGRRDRRAPLAEAERPDRRAPLAETDRSDRREIRSAESTAATERTGRSTTAGRAGRRSGGASGPDPSADPVALAREICLRLLAERARTRHELADALRRKAVPDDAAEAVLERFSEVGLIDDAAFAEQWVRSRHLGRALGRRALVAELRRKGVADELAGAALDGIDPEAEQQRARQLVDRKLRTIALDSPEQRTVAARRLAGMLGRKGYGAGVAYRVVREAIADHGAEDDELGGDVDLD
jgi:regulatory protein